MGMLKCTKVLKMNKIDTDKIYRANYILKVRDICQLEQKSKSSIILNFGEY